MKKFASIILSILIGILVLLTTVEVVVRWDSFYEKQYIKNFVPEITQIELPELMYITDEIQDYLLGSREDFNIIGTINGVRREVFNEREIIHMEDVRVLFEKGLFIRNTCLILSILLLIYLYRKERAQLYSSFFYSSIGFISLGGALILLLTSNFNKYFTLFHEIFFDNDYWILDPAESILINMVPLNFFINITATILIISFGIMFFIGVLGYRLKKGMNRDHDKKYDYIRD